jgi:hypothetical protein
MKLKKIAAACSLAACGLFAAAGSADQLSWRRPNR